VEEKKNLIDILGTQSGEDYASLHVEHTYSQYLNLLMEDARPARSSHQRLYDMILEAGIEDVKVFGDDCKKYTFFSPKKPDGSPHEDAIFGMEKPLMKMVAYFDNAAHKLGGEKRLLLLHGPVGSAKSTIVRIIKAGLENYSRTNPLYSFRWVDADGVFKQEKLVEMGCQIREDPLKLILPEERARILDAINEANAKKEGLKMNYTVEINGKLCPQCSFNLEALLRHYNGDWKTIMQKHVKVSRFLISEANRVGIGSFQPKDEKNQDSTELTGDLNYRKIAIFGSDSDPRAFNFDGEFCVANRGIVEMVELLKLDVAFLYDLLGATQENVIKPKKFPQTSVDMVIIGHTNEAEFKKFHGNDFMEALKDRTLKIDIPYNLRLQDEINVYRKIYTPKKVGKHIAPHTLEIAAVMSVLSRLEDPLDGKNISLLDKLMLYDGKIIGGYTPDFVKKMRLDTQREGLDGLSPRFIQNALADARCENSEPCIDPFMLINAIANNLVNSTQVKQEQAKKYAGTLIEITKRVIEEKVKEDVVMAVAGDEATMTETFEKYMENVKAFLHGSLVMDTARGVKTRPDEMFMRSIEMKMDITEAAKEGHRKTILQYAGATVLSNEPFTYKSNENLRRAIRDKIFDDSKGTINWAAVSAGSIDRITEGKIAMVTKWLFDHDYCEHCATNAMKIAQNIFGREDKEKRR
jgi:serine protein kinase